MRQEINNTPAGSGLGDNLKVAFDKVNDNFIELYDELGTISGSLAKTKTSEFINDGANGVNPFISASQIPSTWNISSISGLQDELDTLNSSSLALSSSLSGSNANIATVQSNISSINTQIGIINTNIITINNEILTIKNRLDILEA